MNENLIGKEVVDSAVKVHRELGTGLLEAVYEVVLAKELQARGLQVERQVPVSGSFMVGCGSKRVSGLTLLLRAR